MEMYVQLLIRLCDMSPLCVCAMCVGVCHVCGCVPCMWVCAMCVGVCHVCGCVSCVSCVYVHVVCQCSVTFI